MALDIVSEVTTDDKPYCVYAHAVRDVVARDRDEALHRLAKIRAIAS